ncbi:MAG TPA: hypothetical protein VHB46_17565 [Burkholderiales bacterium]|nr:hypothetical protein [Burkholderiales bacterium]
MAEHQGKSRHERLKCEKPGAPAFSFDVQAALFLLGYRGVRFVRPIHQLDQWLELKKPGTPGFSGVVAPTNARFRGHESSLQRPYFLALPSVDVALSLSGRSISSTSGWNKRSRASPASLAL